MKLKTLPQLARDYAKAKGASPEADELRAIVDTAAKLLRQEVKRTTTKERKTT